MEADRSTRTYTTPTCSLSVDSAPAPGTNPRGKFTLSVEDPDREPSERVTVGGDVDRLAYLRQIVNRYIAELVAKFPLPKTQPLAETLPVEPPAPPTTAEPSQPDFDDIDTPRSGFIKKNLPGLRKPSPAETPQPPSAPSEPAEQISTIDPADSPYFAAASETTPDRHLHYLHVGNLETTAPDRVLTLSAIQLFDLAAVLDEHSTEVAKGRQGAQATNNFNREAIGERLRSGAAADTANSKLPNQTRTAGDNELDRVYARNQRRPRKSASLLSILPWAAGAAAIVGPGLMLIDPNPNPVKDFIGKLDIRGVPSADRKTAKSKTPKTATTPSALEAIAGNPGTTPTPTVAAPGQWQTQPVTPPAVKTTPTAAPTSAGGTNKISTAMLPNAIAPGTSSQLPTGLDGKTPDPSAGKTANPILSGEAGAMGGLPSASASDPTASKPTAAPSKSPAKPTDKTKPANKAATIGQLPIDNPTPGKVSVSKQPISIPSSPVPPIDLKPAAPIPFNPPDMSDAATSPSPKPERPKTAAKPKAGASAPKATDPQQTAEPFTPVSRNPNLITPEPAPGVDATTTAASGAEPTANAALSESKRYFQGKWKADATQPNALQYVIQVNAKSGTVRSVDPQNESATAALQKSKFVKPGQKLLSPTAAGSTDRKIRVLLQPDGSVETYMEP